jgi:hypothetical protein
MKNNVQNIWNEFQSSLTNQDATGALEATRKLEQALEAEGSLRYRGSILRGYWRSTRNLAKIDKRFRLSTSA